MVFDLSFIHEITPCLLLGVAAICTILLSTLYRSRIARLRRYARKEQKTEGEFPPLSVIVYCRDSSGSLEKMLPQVFSQDYPSPIEVIVTTDGRSSNAEDVVTRQSAFHRNLKMTYVPDEAHALSRKKLAVTLGIKAARYDHVALTDANVIPQSDQWLRLIGRNFSKDKEVVIGICAPKGEDGGNERPMAAFDTLADTVTYISSAIGGNPYRGNDNNIAFAKHLFFDRKGFAQSVGLQHGIDDIFVSGIADKSNSVVELSHGSIPERVSHDPHATHVGEKLQHIFTGKHVSRRSRRFFGFGSLLMWLWLGVTIAVGLTSYPNLLPLAVSLVLGIVWITFVSISWSHASKITGTGPKGALLPILMFVRPIYDFIYKMRARSLRSFNYTSAKPR